MGLERSWIEMRVTCWGVVLHDGLGGRDQKRIFRFVCGDLRRVVLNGHFYVRVQSKIYTLSFLSKT